MNSGSANGCSRPERVLGAVLGSAVGEALGALARGLDRRDG
ncbi:hypothetical protein [Streptomyces sp. NPDC088350]